MCPGKFKPYLSDYHPWAYKYFCCFILLNIPLQILETDVSCGGHRATFCIDCPQGNGASWCNGECTWDNDNSKCVNKGINALLHVFKLGQ